jgi:hypothetical protein
MNSGTREKVMNLKPTGNWVLVKALAQKDVEEPDVVILVYQSAENPNERLEQMLQKWYNKYRVKRVRLMEGKVLKYYQEEL